MNSAQQAPPATIMTVAIDAARAAGQLMLDASQDLAGLSIEQKSLHDYVSEVDRNCEVTIAGIVKHHFPDHAFVGEEFGGTGDDQAEFRWIVDPLDGTTNFLRAIPHYAVSIAVQQAGTIRHAVVYDPAKQELFTASLGEGAFLNNQLISVSRAADIRGALLATGVPFSGKNLAEIGSFTSALESMLAMHTSGIRRLGSAALDLAYVAAGRYEGYWEANLNAWDIAAGVLLVQEAGGQVSDLAGGDSWLQSGDIVAASPGVLQQMVSVTSQFYSR